MKNMITCFVMPVGLLVFTLMLISPVWGESLTDGKNATPDFIISHASDADPDYEIVFPDDTINELYITLTPESWEAMQNDMENSYGGFGNRTSNSPEGMERPEDFFYRNASNDAGLKNPPGGHGSISHDDPIYVPATISFQGEIWDHVGIRYKGLNSLMTAWNQGIGKINMKLDLDHFEDEYPEIKNQKFYGFKELNLQSSMADKTAIREKITPEVFREAGVPAPQTAFYRIYIDHGDGYEYFGLYTLAEGIDDTMIETQFSNADGNLYKPENEGATFAEGKLNLTDFEKKSNEDSEDYSDIQELYDILHSESRNSTPETWRSDLESVLDVNEFVTWLATNTLIGNFDTYGGNARNYYLYHNPDNGTFSWIPWDNNYAFMQGMPGGGPGGMNQADRTGNPPPGWLNQTMGELSPDHDPLVSMSSGPVRESDPEWMNQSGRSLNLPPSDLTIAHSGINPGQNYSPGRSAGMYGDEVFGGMGSSVSFSMENVTDQWPLIRYLMDDPVYHERYVNILLNLTAGAFDPDTLAQKIDLYHDLVESSVIGPDGEREGYTYLTDESDFDTACEEMKAHIRSQYEKAMEYLRSEGLA